MMNHDQAHKNSRCLEPMLPESESTINRQGKRVSFESDWEKIGQNKKINLYAF